MGDLLKIENDLLIIILSVIVLLLLGLILWVIKQAFFKENIERVMSKLIKKEEFKETINIGRKYLEKKSPRFFVAFYLGEAYEKTQNWVNALKFYNDAGVIITKSNTLYYEILLRMARIYNKIGKPKESLAHYLMAVEANDNLEALYEIALHHYVNKNPKKAREYLERLLKKRPGLLDARFLFGKILFEIGNYDVSLKQFELLQKYDRNNGEIFYYKAKVLENLKQYSNALENYQKAVEFSNLDKNIVEEIKIRSAYLYIKIKDYYNGRLAVSVFLEGQLSDKTRQELLYISANLLWNSGYEFQSIKKYEETYMLNPEFKDVSIIYEKYKELFSLNSLEKYFTGDELRFESTCLMIIGRNKFDLLYRSAHYYIYTKDSYYIIFYRHIEAPGFSKLTDIEMLMNSMGIIIKNGEIYSLYGVGEKAAVHSLIKKSRIIERDEFIGLLSDEVN